MEAIIPYVLIFIAGICGGLEIAKMRADSRRRRSLRDELRRLHLNSDDVVILTVDGTLGVKEAESIRSAWDMFRNGDATRLAALVIQRGMKLEVVGRDRLAALNVSERS